MICWLAFGISIFAVCVHVLHRSLISRASVALLLATVLSTVASVVCALGNPLLSLAIVVLALTYSLVPLELARTLGSLSPLFAGFAVVAGGSAALCVFSATHLLPLPIRMLSLALPCAVILLVATSKDVISLAPVSGSSLCVAGVACSLVVPFALCFDPRIATLAPLILAIAVALSSRRVELLVLSEGVRPKIESLLVMHTKTGIPILTLGRAVSEVITLVFDAMRRFATAIVGAESSWILRVGHAYVLSRIREPLYAACVADRPSKSLLVLLDELLEKLRQSVRIETDVITFDERELARVRSLARKVFSGLIR